MSLDDVEDYLINASESDDSLQVSGGDEDGAEGILVGLEGVFAEYLYPFEIGSPFMPGDLLGDLVAIAREYGAERMYADLADQIEAFEGIEVSITNYDRKRLERRHNRVFINDHFQMHYPSPYPYKRPMSGSKTAKDWLTDRFNRHHVGLYANLEIPTQMNMAPADLWPSSWIPIHKLSPFPMRISNGIVPDPD